MALVVVVVPTLLPSKTESDEGMALYSPQRALRQLSYDQEAVTIIEDSRNFSLSIVEAQFIRDSRDSILAGSTIC